MRAILTYHSIDDSGSVISVDEDRFRAHIRWLASSNVAVVPIEKLLSLPADADAVALTFDDGFVNFGETAWPVLHQQGLPATLFVVTERAGQTNAWGPQATPAVPTLPLLDWPALGRLAEAGVSLGSHTKTHPNLRNATSDALSEEIEGAADRLESETGQRPVSFAYPYGAFSNDAVAAVARSHSIAVTTEFRALGDKEDLLRVPRLDSFYFRRPGALESWGTPAFRRHVWLRARGRGLRRVFEAAGGLA